MHAGSDEEQAETEGQCTDIVRSHSWIFQGWEDYLQGIFDQYGGVD